ncbi:MAG: flagellar basal-body rod protein FlgF [Acidobacteriota bacterium]
MDSGFYAACAALVSRTQALDTIANNLANVSTTGFRATHNVFSSMLAQSGATPVSVLNQDANDYDLLSKTQLDSSQGSLVNTNNPMDFALEGQGYFAVQTASGVAFTRGGTFRVTAQHQLVTSEGDPLLGPTGPILLPPGPISVSSDGTIAVNGATAGRFRMVEFPPNVQLGSSGRSYYTAPPSAKPAAVTTSTVHQGALESSNVNPVTSVIELITAQRDVERMRNVLSLLNGQMDKTAAQDLPRVG